MIKKPDMKTTSKGEKNRKAILVAARRSFEQFGFSKTTIDDIAKASKRSKSALFYYFDSKETLFYHSFVSVWERELINLIETARSEYPLGSRIQKYIALSADYYGAVAEQFGTSVSVLIETEAQFDEILKPTVHAEIRGFYKETIELGIGTGAFAKADAGRLAELIGKVERSFRSDAFKSALAEGRPRVDFKALADDTVFVVSSLLSINKPTY